MIKHQTIEVKTDGKFMDEVIRAIEQKLPKKADQFLKELPFKTLVDRMVFDRLPLSDAQKIEILHNMSIEGFDQQNSKKPSSVLLDCPS